MSPEGSNCRLNGSSISAWLLLIIFAERLLGLPEGVLGLLSNQGASTERNLAYLGGGELYPGSTGLTITSGLRELEASTTGSSSLSNSVMLSLLVSTL